MSITPFTALGKIVIKHVNNKFDNQRAFAFVYFIFVIFAIKTKWMPLDDLSEWVFVQIA